MASPAPPVLPGLNQHHKLLQNIGLSRQSKLQSPSAKKYTKWSRSSKATRKRETARECQNRY